MIRIVVFDLDGTLAVSKAPLDEEMLLLLAALLDLVQVAIISGGNWPQFEKQVLSKLPSSATLHQLSLLPTCGTKFFEFNEIWKPRYSEDFTVAQKEEIVKAIKDSVVDCHLEVKKTWGEEIEDRGGQITYSALGQQAPIDEKKWWDPDLKKRMHLKMRLDELLPDFSVRLGGTTSIDITKSGIDKAYGIHKLCEILGLEISEMLFVGDALFPGGNDYPVKAAGVLSIQVRDPDESKRVIEAIIACLSSTHKQPVVVINL